MHTCLGGKGGLLQIAHLPQGRKFILQCTYYMKIFEIMLFICYVIVSKQYLACAAGVIKGKRNLHITTKLPRFPIPIHPFDLEVHVRSL